MLATRIYNAAMVIGPITPYSESVYLDYKNAQKEVTVPCCTYIISIMSSVSCHGDKIFSRWQLVPVLNMSSAC